MTTKYRTSRRNFLKTGATIGGVLVAPAFSTRVFAETVKDGQTIITAAHWGPLAVVVKDGKIQSSAPAIEDLGDNPLQTVVADQVYNKVRITQPMIRKGFLDNLDNITQPDGKRGDDAFVPVSWERAYDIIEQQLRRIYASYGPQSIFAGSYGWRSAGVLHKAFTLMQRFLNLAGGYVGHLGDYSTGAAQVILPHVLGTLEVYEQQTSWEVVLDESKVVVLWGMNLYNSSQIAWSASTSKNSKNTKTSKYSPLTPPGAKLPTSSAKDRCEWIAANPSSDVPLMLAICHELIRQNWHDTEFLKKYTVGYDAVRAYVFGDKDGIPKTPEWAAPITGVPAEKSANWRDSSTKTAP